MFLRHLGVIFEKYAVLDVDSLLLATPLLFLISFLFVVLSLGYVVPADFLLH